MFDAREGGRATESHPIRREGAGSRARPTMASSNIQPKSYLLLLLAPCDEPIFA